MTGIRIPPRLQLLLVLVVLMMMVGSSDGFAPFHNHRPWITATTKASPTTIVPRLLLLSSSPSPENETTSDEEVEKANMLQKLNSVLDTPILDANNKADQGPVVNALKNFVRDDPEVASVTFSVVVVVFMAVLTRGAMFVVNGY